MSVSPSETVLVHLPKLATNNNRWLMSSREYRHPRRVVIVG
jgi:hypothetical protein